MTNKAGSEIFKDDYNLDLLELVNPLGDNFSIYVTPRFKIIYSSGYEHLSTRIFKNLIKKCDLFIDVGANYGYYSVLAAKSNKTIKIIAIEPIDENLKVLKMNLSHNNIGSIHATCIKAAVSSGPGKVNFYKSEASDNSSVLPHPSSKTLEQFEIKSLSLDEILINEQFKSLFIKSDTDGNELEVLKGLKSTFEKCNDITLLFEINPKMLKLAGNSCEEMIDYLQSRDFKLFGIDDKGFRYYPLDIPGNLEMMTGIYENTYFNILCVKKSKSLSLVFFSHDSSLSGASRSLFDLQLGLSEQGVLCTTVLPGEGALKDKLRESGISTYTLSRWELSQISWHWVEWPGKLHNDLKRKIMNTYSMLFDHVIPELKKISPDLIFSQTIVSPWGAVCASQLGIPHALSAREYGVFDHNFNFYLGFEESIKALYNNSDVVFCVTHDIRNTLFNEDIDQKTTVVYNGIQPDILDVNNDNKTEGSIYSANWGKGIKVGVFGTINKGKGQEDIVRACIELSRKGYNISCILVGHKTEMEYFQHLNQMIISSGFPDRFIWFDFLNDPYKLMKEVDIIVSCSRMEALGRTLFESILLFKPIIYADSGGPKEVFSDGIHGLSYKAGDYHGLAEKILITVSDNEDTKRRMQFANEYITKKFNRENYASLVKEKLERIKIKNHINHNHNAILDLMKTAGIEPKDETLLQPKIYYSQIANGFNERQCVLADKLPPGLFSIEITLPDQGYNHLRFDPLENSALELIIFIISVTYLNGESSDNPTEENYSNGINIGKRSWRFLNFDPQVHFTFKLEVKTIKVIGEVKLISLEEVIFDLRKELIRKDEVISLKNEAIKQKNESLNMVYSSKSWRITKPLRFILHILQGILPKI